MISLPRRMDWFLLGMAAAVALAWAFPEPGAQGGWLQPELLTHLGVALIFFLHGLGLPFEALKAGVKLWKLHLLVQGTTFLLFPLLGWIAIAPEGGLPEALKMGFFFLCALPSTVSSSVAMTALARGNVAAAVFNATLSSLLGIALTPLWMSLLFHTEGAAPLGEVMLDLVRWLLLPLLAGQVMRPWLGAWAARHKQGIHRIDRGTILLLLYTSFCDSMQWGVWTQQGLCVVVIAFVMVSLLFALMLGFTMTASKALGFGPEERAAAVFCGTKKSLAQGVPMAQLMFASSPALGMILLPIMLYHPLQLFLCGLIAGRWAKRAS